MGVRLQFDPTLSLGKLQVLQHLPNQIFRKDLAIAQKPQHIYGQIQQA